MDRNSILSESTSKNPSRNINQTPNYIQADSSILHVDDLFERYQDKVEKNSKSNYH